MRALTVEPFDARKYEPYGAVIEAPSERDAGAPANQGSARRFDHVAAFDNLRAGRAPTNVAVFRCAPRALPFEIAMLEKHPNSTQIFVPMHATRYVVVVALGDDRPDLASLRAFVAGDRQGVSYRPGVWHHPMIALDETCEFVCFVNEDGSSGDCVEFALAEAERRVLTI